MIAWKTKGTALYQSLAGEMHQYGKACEPLHEVPVNQALQDNNYTTWKDENK